MDSGILVGNVAREPELRSSAGHEPTVHFSIAVSRRWRNRVTHQWEERTSFIEVVASGQLAENAAKALARNVRVIVAGRFERHDWLAEDGTHRHRAELVAQEIGLSLKTAPTEDVPVPSP